MKLTDYRHDRRREKRYGYSAFIKKPMKTHLLKKIHHKKREKDMHVAVTHGLVHKTMKTNRLEQKHNARREKNMCWLLTAKTIQYKLTS